MAYESPARDGGRSHVHSRWSWLLLVPLVGTLIPSIYNKNAPTIIGVPFFCWYKEYLHRDATLAQEARMSRLASLVVKAGAVVAILEINPQFSIDLQLIGGVITLPALVFGLYTRWFHAWELSLGWLAGLAAGLYMVYDTPNPSTGRAHVVVDRRRAPHDRGLADPGALADERLVADDRAAADVCAREDDRLGADRRSLLDHQRLRRVAVRAVALRVRHEGHAVHGCDRTGAQRGGRSRGDARPAGRPRADATGRDAAERLRSRSPGARRAAAAGHAGAGAGDGAHPDDRAPSTSAERAEEDPPARAAARVRRALG